ncbi:hypothetical protein BH09MYX1_BH09MYX1_32840 [soil metagenome]
MYVQCERCKTEYDFDDALVSERGTTVKCTQCAHQFKVRRSETGTDRWVVTTVSGKSLVFTSLRELQKAILGKQVGRGDSLARGNAPPRILGSIAELEPFFEGKRTSIPAASEVAGGAAVKRPSRPPAASVPPPAPPKRNRVDTLRPPAEGSGAIPPPQQRSDVSPFASTLRASSALANTPHLPPPAPMPVIPQAPPTIPTAPPLMDVAPPDPPTVPAFIADPPVRREHSPSIPAMAQTAPAMASPLPPSTRPRQDLFIEARTSYADIPPARRPIGGWVVAAFLFIGVCVLGFVVARPYLTTPPPKTTADLPPLDPRAQKLVDDADRALGDGDLDGAKENADKASVLADKDPRVLLIVTRVANARADQAWLRVALLPPNAGEPLTLAKKDRDDLANKARSAAEAAVALSPEDPATLRAKIDALRIAGDITGARSLVSKINAIASQPETSYVLAALDLSEPAPPNAQLLARLREAADAERGLGRARTALVFALARSGDSAAARKEIERLLTLPRPYPLLQPLREYVDRAPAPVGDAGPVAVVDVGNLPQTNPAGTGGGVSSSDPRVLLAQAETAKGKGDFEKAKGLYGKVIEGNPTDSEALAGLGQIAYTQHDLANAQTYFRRAVAANGSYVPALVGLGDAQWDSGDHPGAQKTYKDIVDRFPDAAYPGYVKQRTESSGTAPTTTTTATATATASDNGGN